MFLPTSLMTSWNNEDDYEASNTKDHNSTTYFSLQMTLTPSETNSDAESATITKIEIIPVNETRMRPMSDSGT